MDKRRLFWLVFLGVAALSALLPAFFEGGAIVVVQPVPRLRPVAPTPAPAVRRGLLTELRAPAGPADGARAGSPGKSSAPPDAGRAAMASVPIADLFAAHSWEPLPLPSSPPSPAGPPVAAPPAVVAPPLPFAYLGKLDDSRRVRVFLVQGERLLTVGEGDVIEGAYAVKAITATHMRLVYLPLNLDQTLALGSQP